MEIEGGRIEIAGGVEENARGGRALAGEGGVEGFAVEIGEVDFGEVALESGQVEVVAVAGTEDADAAAGSGGGGGNQLVNAAAVRGAAFPGVAGLAVGSDVAFGDLGMVSPGCGLSVKTRRVETRRGTQECVRHDVTLGSDNRLYPWSSFPYTMRLLGMCMTATKLPLRGSRTLFRSRRDTRLYGRGGGT
jgi:hypothetical protein